MPRILFGAYCLVVLGFFNQPILAQGNKPVNPPKRKSVEALAKATRASIVVIRQGGRGGKERGIGTGFIVAKDGLIATNLHVIGEARPISVKLNDGKSYPVKSVFASDRRLDLALLKIDAKNLKPLSLGDSDKLKIGADIVAIGHPQGLKYSIVAGVVSGRPKFDGRSMIQLALPIERGNSGGPVLDRRGRVQGIVTLKSQVTANLGFAVPVNDLIKLMRRPNPIPMKRWVTIGRINPDQWQTVFQGNWRQNKGRIIVDGPGEGFGGRSLCLSKSAPPKVPYELEVTVKLDPESGAGGLCFHADGGNKHYGFYPTNGKMRLSRFEGADVFTWNVLYSQPSMHYLSGGWNTIKVRVEKSKFLCYVNDKLVIESRDDGLTKGKVGLVKFRATHVEFKNFRIGKKLKSLRPSEALTKKVALLAGKIALKGPLDHKHVDSLLKNTPAGMKALRDRAALLEQQAKKLRELATTIHHKKILGEITKTVKKKKIDLLRMALLISKMDNEELDVESYIQQVNRMAKEIEKTLPRNAGGRTILGALNKELFQRRGFHGSRTDYYNRANSYVDQVLDDREGLPITLSLLYMELAERLGAKVVGVGLPGHFVVRHLPEKGKPYLIDVFEGGRKLTRAEAELRVRSLTKKPLQEADLQAVSKKALLIRILYNLTANARDEANVRAIVRYQDAILTIDPNLVQERMLRAAANYELGNKTATLADLDWLLDNSPPGLDRRKVRRLRRLLDR